MAGKLDGKAIEDETIDATRLSSEITFSSVKINSISYPSGSSNVSPAGSEVIEIVGSGFDANSKVYINFELATNYTVTNANSISVTTPSQIDSGFYFLQVVNPDGEAVDFVPGIEYGVFPPFPQGTNYGYTSGGAWQTPPDNIIDKFPFASDANATDVGNLTEIKRNLAGQSSYTHGYTTGGAKYPSTTYTKTIDKFSFASDGNASSLASLESWYEYNTGQSSTTNGYSSGGYRYPTGNSATKQNTNVIEKFPFSADVGGSDVGDLTQARSIKPAGQNSTENGYTSGGLSSFPPSVYSNVIDKFPFATDANATDVGDLTLVRAYTTGQSSTTSGYTSGGALPSVNTIDKFPFASNANATDVGDLSQARYNLAGQSSTASGYSSGGSAPSASNVIDKFPFASDANATDVGDLTVGRTSSAGQQY